MATLQELHNRVGNPDFSHWNPIKLFSIVEIGLLTTGIEPLEYSNLLMYQVVEELKDKKPMNWQHALMLMRSLTEAICTHEIKSPCVFYEAENDSYAYHKEQATLGLDDINNIIWTGTKIHREELQKWLKRNGYFQPTLKVTQNNPTTVLIPQHNYKTHALDALNGVIQEFWVNYDPDGSQPPPKQNTVASWIQANYPHVQGNELCIYIDKICRHPNAKKGGNTKMKQSNILKDITLK